MSYKKDFNAFVGGMLGVFKGLNIESKACISKNIQSLVFIKDNDDVTALSWGDEEEKEVLIACGVKKDRSIKVYDSECSMFTCSFCCDSGQGRICGISRYDEAIITAVESGEIKLWKFDDENKMTIDAGPNLCKMTHSSVNKNIIATGGRENNLKLFDLEKQKLTFVEKNLPHDRLQLRVPMWISDIGFLPQHNEVVTSDRYGKIRLYDPKAQRRPVITAELKDQALMTMAVCHRDKQVIVGSGTGVMKLVDLRKPGRVLNMYKGFAGSVTGVACCPTKPYVVSVSLDRYIRVHHIDTKALLRKEYLTSRLTSLLLRSEFSIEEQTVCSEESTSDHIDGSENGHYKNIGASEENSNSDAEYDALFDKMAVITNERDKKRKVSADCVQHTTQSDAVADKRTKRKRKCKKSKSDPSDT